MSDMAKEIAKNHFLTAELTLRASASCAREVAKRYQGDICDAFRTYAALLDRKAADMERLLNA